MEDMTVTASGYDFGDVHAVMRRYVDANILAGVSSAILVGRELADVHCAGWADKERDDKLRVDHIFRVFSNTKLITSCAAMLLFEEGQFQLDDPIERYIPQLANRRVLRPGAASLDDTEPARSPITIRHLMTHSSGLSYGLLDPGTLIYQAYNERKVIDPGLSLADMVEALADLPLVFHPGTSWEYSVATDVMARLIEILSGQRFDLFIQSRIIDPLGMVDTGFVVPEAQRRRLAAYYCGADPLDPMKPGLIRADHLPYPQAYLRPVPKLSGGGGLVSTLPDMVALLRSLLPGGPKLLKPETIGLMMTNQLPAGVWVRFPQSGEIYGRGHGLVGSIILLPSEIDPKDSTGELQWGGIAGTHWWISPKMNFAGLLMMQREMAFVHPFRFEFKRLTYEAITRTRDASPAWAAGTVCGGY
jgi:CubicO group peptidase (beta-lactamase class C family)